MVLDSIFEISNVSTTPNKIINKTANVEAIDCIAPVK